MPFKYLEQHTNVQKKTGIYIYLATIFLISNGLYLTTVYDEVNDPVTSCVMSVFVLAGINNGRCYD